MESSYFKTSETAVVLGISPQSLTRFARENRSPIPFVLIGKQYRFRKTDVEAFCGHKIEEAKV